MGDHKGYFHLGICNLIEEIYMALQNGFLENYFYTSFSVQMFFDSLLNTYVKLPLKYFEKKFYFSCQNSWWFSL